MQITHSWLSLQSVVYISQRFCIVQLKLGRGFGEVVFGGATRHLTSHSDDSLTVQKKREKKEFTQATVAGTSSMQALCSIRS